MRKRTPQAFQEIIDKVERSDLRGFALRQLAMDLLGELEHYNWSGIYRLEGDMLYLDAFDGVPTEHRTIPVGRGVCGTAVATGENQIVPDVRELENYLSCSVHTKSEIVVLIRRGEMILGQIDIDGHQVDAFERADEKFLEKLGEILANRWEDRHAL